MGIKTSKLLRSLYYGIAIVLLCFPATDSQSTRLTAERDAYLNNKLALSQKRSTERQERVLNYSQKYQLPIKEYSSDGSLIEFIDVVNQHPVYYHQLNKGSAKTMYANLVYNGGGSNLDLSGDGILVAIWDADTARTSHQEFAGNRLTRGDNATTLNFHNTHVAGTIGATGVDSKAKGIAYKASLKTHNWNNDQSEMRAAAKDDNLRVSNHSYGTVSGWQWYSNDNIWKWHGYTTISNTEDYKFGFYSSQARQWDDIAYDYPNYLIVKAAGNDRNDTGPDQGKDNSGNCITQENYQVIVNNNWADSKVCRDPDGDYDSIPLYGVAKNILTVGAVKELSGDSYSSHKDVVMASFSSWGPADDGRIKPDIVAKGVDVYSTYPDRDDQYNSISGTSMATPAISGGIALLLEHQVDLHGTTALRSSTVKALLIHTAHEAGGAAGPDYKFGWGLANIDAAAKLMTQDDTEQGKWIKEVTIEDGKSYSFQFLHNGEGPLKATIVWTDKQGPAISASLNPSKKALIHDLDLRVTKTESGKTTTYLPWVLDKADPSKAATKGDNTVDNVEQVLIPDSKTSNSIYTITISHSGSLSADQVVSLVIDPSEGLAPPILTVPSADIITSNPMVLIKGTVVNGADVDVYHKKTGASSPTKWGAASVSGTNWYLDPNWIFPSGALSDGAYAIYSKSIVGGESSAFSTQSITITVDTTANPPVISSHSNTSYENTQKPTISGTGESGSTVYLYGLPSGASPGNNTLWGTKKIASDSNSWSITPAANQAEETYQLKAKIIDAVGNESGFNNPVPTIILDITKPNKPNIASPTTSKIANSSPDFSVSAENGTTVKLYDKTKSDPIKTISNISSPQSFKLSSELDDGDYDLYITATDHAGNTSVDSDTITLTIDTTADIPVISSPSFPYHTRQASLSLVGTQATDISEIKVYKNNQPSGYASLDSATDWSFSDSSFSDDGDYEYFLVVTDDVDNVDTSNVVTMTLDTVAPDKPEITDPSSDISSKNAKVPISGKGEKEAVIHVYSGSSLVATKDIEADGTWSIIPPGSWLSDGTHTITAKVVDRAGNTSNVSAESPAIFIDTSPPMQPSISFPSGDIVTQSTSITISGSGEQSISGKPPMTAELWVDGVTTDLDIEASGDWSHTLTGLTDGDYELKARVKDTVGNLSSYTSSRKITVDNINPPIPKITVPKNNQFFKSLTPSFTGTGEANSIIYLYIDDGQSNSFITSKNIASNGTWSHTPSSDLINDKGYKLTAKVIDLADNEGALSSPHSFFINTALPPTPVITGAPDSLSTTNSRPVISGTAFPGTTLRLYFNKQYYEFSVGNQGVNSPWSFSLPTDLIDGNYSIKATVTNSLGKSSNESATLVYSVDSQIPAAPKITFPLATVYTNQVQPSIKGIADFQSTVYLYANNNDSNSLLVTKNITNSNRTWDLAPSSDFSHGQSYEITAVSIDDAGNKSTTSNQRLVFIIDTQKPVPPVISYPPEGLLSMSNSRPSIRGSTEAGSTVVFYRDTIEFGRYTSTDEQFNFSASQALPEGNYVITAKSIDLAGNISDSSIQSVSIEIDTTPPAIPSITGPEKGSYHKTKQPIISGTSEQTVSINLYVEDQLIGSGSSDSNGVWSFPSSVAVSDGKNTIKARSVDTVGNESDGSNGLEINIDTVPPDKPALTAPLGKISTDNTRPQIFGTGEEGSLIELYSNTTTLLGSTRVFAGCWVIKLEKDLSYGENHTITAFSTDISENRSQVSETPLVFYYGSPGNPPTIPSFLLASDSIVTSNSSPLLTGLMNNNNSIRVISNDTTIWKVEHIDEKTWKAYPEQALLNGTYTLRLQGLDDKGTPLHESESHLTLKINNKKKNSFSIHSISGQIVTNNPQPLISGTVPTHLKKVHLLFNEQLMGTAKINNSGAKWEYSPASPLKDQQYTIKAQRAHQLTIQRFGKTMGLFIPLYLSNECYNNCSYCGFSMDLDYPRKTLSDSEILQEAALIKEKGFDHLLILTGEAPKTVGVDYIENAVRLLKPFFSSIGIEVQPLKTEDYARLLSVGVDSLTVYQETYHIPSYKKHHITGKKRLFDHRLDAMDRGGKAGFYRMTIGALLGLYDWRFEALAIAEHLHYLQKTYWQTKLGISIPRIKDMIGDFEVEHPVSDHDMVQFVTAFRLVFSDLSISLSTRESAEFRDAMLPLGITDMSAESQTNPGGYSGSEETAQFELSDHRPLEDILSTLSKKGYDPMLKNWDRSFIKDCIKDNIKEEV